MHLGRYHLVGDALPLMVLEVQHVRVQLREHLLEQGSQHQRLAAALLRIRGRHPTLLE